MNVFCEQLKQLRKDAGLNQSELGKKLNCQRTRIADLERGRTTPTIEDITILCNTFNVSSDYLLGLSGIATTDAELKAVCEYTGLSDKAVTSIKKLTTEEDKKYLINFLLSDSSFYDMLYHFSMYLKEYFYAVISLSSSIKSSEYCKTLSKEELKTEENIAKINYHLEEHKKKAEEATSHIKDARYHLFENIESLKKGVQKFNPFSEKYYELLEDYYRTHINDIDDIDEWLLLCNDVYSVPSETFDNLFDDSFKEILSIFKVGDFKWQP